MIKLTEQQIRAAAGGRTPLTVTDPKTKMRFVLIPAEEYKKLTRARYDSAPWTEEEMDSLAVEAGELLDKFGKKR